MSPMEVDGVCLAGQGSIDTLVGWQMLAQSVAERQQLATAISDCSTHSVHNMSEDPAGGHSRDVQAPPARTLSDQSTSSSHSDGSGMQVAMPNVAPRPHQWLYKEYKLLDEIGSGGFGSVHRARRLADGELVVVKVIKTNALSPKQKAATMDEVEVLNKLDHPNVVNYHDCFSDEQYINIVMEYCDAGDLGEVIKRRHGQLIPEEEVMRYFIQICLALQYVHSRNVLHRDLKASNVMATSAGVLKLVDFGVSKISNTGASIMSSTLVGTPHYLSPEMCDNKPYGKKSDVWALGCVLCELLSLTKAFDASSISKIILLISKAQYVRPPDVYSEHMRDLLDRLLTVKPEQRPSLEEVMNMPFVREHLAKYWEWARDVPLACADVAMSAHRAIQGRPRIGSSFSARHLSAWRGVPRDTAAAAAADATPAPPQAAAAGAAAPAAPRAALQGGQQPEGQHPREGPSPRGSLPATTAPVAPSVLLSPSAAAAPLPSSGAPPRPPPVPTATGLPPLAGSGGSGSSSASHVTSDGSLAQEQLEGMKRLRSLKYRLGMGNRPGPAGSTSPASPLTSPSGSSTGAYTPRH